MYINRVRDIDPGTQKDLYYIDLCTREFIANEQCRVVKRYDGEISKNIKDILTRELGGRKKDNTVYGLMTEKPIEVDKTVTPYNFIGNDKKPFYICTWLASKSAPDMTTKEGKPTKGGAAGYFFYETHDGFKFKSIDKLLDVKFIGPKYIFTNTPDLPTEYNGKILSATVERDIDLQQNLSLIHI